MGLLPVCRRISPVPLRGLVVPSSGEPRYLSAAAVLEGYEAPHFLFGVLHPSRRAAGERHLPGLGERLDRCNNVSPAVVRASAITLRVIHRRATEWLSGPRAVSGISILEGSPRGIAVVNLPDVVVGPEVIPMERCEERWYDWPTRDETPI